MQVTGPAAAVHLQRFRAAMQRERRVLLRVQVGNPGMFAALLLAGSLGLVAAATLIAAIIARASVKGALFAVLSFPLLAPLLVIAIKGTALALEGAAWARGLAAVLPWYCRASAATPPTRRAPMLVRSIVTDAVRRVTGLLHALSTWLRVLPIGRDDCSRGHAAGCERARNTSLVATNVTEHVGIPRA